MLADDLNLINTAAASTVHYGAIQIDAPITGTGNITVSNTQTAVPGYFHGVISLNGANTFTGNLLIQRGTLGTTHAGALGAATNVVTLGQAGQGDAVLGLGASSAATIQNPIVAAAGTGGTSTLVLGAGQMTVSGGVTLNGDLTIAALPISTTLSGTISGPGKFTKSGEGGLYLTGENTYTGGTTVTEGVLYLYDSLGGNPGTLGSGPVTVGTVTNVAALRLGRHDTYTMTDTLAGRGVVLLQADALRLTGLVSPGFAGSGTLTIDNLQTATSGGLDGTLQFTDTTRFAYTLGTSSTKIFLRFTTDLDLGAGVIEFGDFDFTTGAGFGASQYTLIELDFGGSVLGTLGSVLTGLIGSSGYEGTLALSGKNLVLNVALAPIPEPATWAALAGAGALGLALWRRGARKRSVA